MGTFHVKRSRYANLVQENETRRRSGGNDARDLFDILRQTLPLVPWQRIRPAHVVCRC